MFSDHTITTLEPGGHCLACPSFLASQTTSSSLSSPALPDESSDLPGHFPSNLSSVHSSVITLFGCAAAAALWISIGVMATITAVTAMTLNANVVFVDILQ